MDSGSNLAFKACVSLNSTLDSNKEEEGGLNVVTERTARRQGLSWLAVRDREREFFIDNLLDRIHFIEMILVDRPCPMKV